MANLNNPSLTIQDNKIILDNEIILDCNDRIHNISRVVGHVPSDQKQNFVTVIDLITLNYQRHQQMNFEKTPPPMLYSVIDTLLSDYFMRHGEPLRIAEIGCNNGVMSFHIAPLLAAYDPNADYVCVCNTIGNESNNQWLDLISQVTPPDGLALIASDFSHTLLQKEHFDVTVINGDVHIDDPMKVIEEAARITKPNGRIFCFSIDQYLLNDTFRMMFPERKEYMFNEELVIFSAERNNIWK